MTTINYFQIKDLNTDPNNVRTHSSKNIEAIKESLRKFGQVKPIVINSDHIVVAGNGTLQAAKELGWTQIQTVEIPSDWDSAKIKAYAIADNRSGELANWDLPQLTDQLEELKEYGFQLQEIGFTKQDLETMTRLEEAKQKGKTDPYEEWVGMPEYDQENLQAAFKVTVNFKSEQDAKDFFLLIDRPKKASMWWPVDEVIESNRHDLLINEG
jgi:hypothetical protein